MKPGLYRMKHLRCASSRRSLRLASEASNITEEIAGIPGYLLLNVISQLAKGYCQSMLDAVVSMKSTAAKLRALADRLERLSSEVEESVDEALGFKRRGKALVSTQAPPGP